MKFKLGNMLRGYFSGDYHDKDDAWANLSKRFLMSYPSPTGRWVEMLILKENEFGIDQWVVCKDGYARPEKQQG